jgi:hypothetical protein
VFAGWRLAHSEGDVRDWRGKHIFTRFIWTSARPSGATEQAYSADGGRSWENNRIMEFTRRR